MDSWTFDKLRKEKEQIIEISNLIHYQEIYDKYPAQPKPQLTADYVLARLEEIIDAILTIESELQNEKH